MSAYDFTNIVAQIAHQENVQNCNAEFLYTSNKGDGYVGTVQAVTLNGTNKSLHLVMKYSHRNPSTHEKVPIRLAYLTEIRFYEKIMPAFRQLQLECKVKNPFNNVPKYYGCVRDPLNELIVMENLRKLNYEMWDRMKLMNREHLECAFKTYAKFHTLSFAMQEIKPEAYQEISSELVNVYDVFMQKMNMYSQLRNLLLSYLDVFDKNTEKHYRDKLEVFAKALQLECEDTYNFHDHDVIIQGDSWCSNSLYQYTDKNNREKPDDVKLIDFQCVRTASPAIDLVYFFYTIAGKEHLDNVDHYTKLYYDALAQNMKQYDLNIENIFSYEKLLKHWRAVAKFGLIIAFMARRAMVANGEDTPEVDNEDFINNIRINEEKEAEYRKQVKDLVTHCVDKHFI